MKKVRNFALAKRESPLRARKEKRSLREFHKTFCREVQGGHTIT